MCWWLLWILTICTVKKLEKKNVDMYISKIFAQVWSRFVNGVDIVFHIASVCFSRYLLCLSMFVYLSFSCLSVKSISQISAVPEIRHMILFSFFLTCASTGHVVELYWIMDRSFYAAILLNDTFQGRALSWEKWRKIARGWEGRHFQRLLLW